MFWSKSEKPLDDSGTKVLLQRKFLWGKPHFRQYVEGDLPIPNGHPVGTIHCLTRRRAFWKLRFWTPLQSTYFVLTDKKRWVQMCRTFH